MKFTFRKPHETIGWLEFQSMNRKGIQLPLHKGINLIGKGLEDFCEYNERDELRGIVEQSQVIIRIDEKGCWIADATSTNQTTLIQGKSAKYVKQKLQLEYELIKSSVYFDVCPLPNWIKSEDIIQMPWQALQKISGLNFIALNDGDILCHIYGIMIFRLS
jgi:hypothetical protein